VSTADRATSVIAPLGKSIKRTYKMAVFESLYELIQTLMLPPGERLVEADLAARFGVSKTPVREALLLLEQEGLVTTVPHVGATVTWLSLEDYEQRLFILDALEQSALPLVVERITPDEIEACDHLVGSIVDAYMARDESRYSQLVIQLHASLFAAARYPLLTQLINSMQQSLRRYTIVFVHHFEENWKQELAVVTQRFEHVRRGDALAAAAAVQQGRARMVDFARERVQMQDPWVWRYMMPLAESFSHARNTVEETLATSQRLAEKPL
jgi:DNA-binding GntR family transcriptional regulator